jgi:GT2 family glycosyltransferase
MSTNGSHGNAERNVIVVLGMLSKIPVAGVVWQTLHYLVGLERLGYRVYYVEEHAGTPSMLMEHESDDSSLRAAEFIDSMLRPFGFGDRWAFHALHENGGWYGMTESRIRRLYSSAELVINLHGGTEPRPEHYETGRLVFVETDPVQVQLELAEGRPEASAYLAPHSAFFTFAENYGGPDCPLPVSDRFDFRATRQPVVIDFWAGRPSEGHLFTTVGNWRQQWRDLEHEGETYSWSKDREFRKVLDLPERAGRVFELALGSLDESDARMLIDHGWRLRDPAAISADPDAYRNYITASAGELTVAKDQNVRFRTGWFSDRSATYLAAGRPVITQDTGFGCALPTGEGLLAFTTLEEAAAAVTEVRADYDRHSRAASEIASEYFDSGRVLGRLLAEVGAPRVAHSVPLRIVSRRPTRLDPDVERSLVEAALPAPRRAEPRPEVSAIVVAVDGLPFTRLCVESVLASIGPMLELVVVDNASVDATAEYLQALALQDGRVRVVRSDVNLGFAGGVNRGLEVVRGSVIVIMNNDVVVPPAALARLARHASTPGVGLVGPVSNEAATEAEIDEEWGTFGELLAVSAARAAESPDRLLDVEMLTLFCAALDRDVLADVGPLDERFAVGLFEDDDYSLRVREAGLRVVVAEDVVVHHFGEASIGKLVPTGEYAEIFEANRRRFEEKWGRPWEQHRRRTTADYALLVDRVRTAVSSALPAAATVLVVSRGDEALLDLAGRAARHFPQGRDGAYAGHYPGDSAEAIVQLEEQRTRGAQYLLFPKTSFWWLDHYAGFRQYLEERYPRAVDDAEACVIYGLNGGNGDG